MDRPYRRSGARSPSPGGRYTTGGRGHPQHDGYGQNSGYDHHQPSWNGYHRQEHRPVYDRRSRSKSPSRNRVIRPRDAYEEEERIPPPRRYDHEYYQPERPKRNDSAVEDSHRDQGHFTDHAEWSSRQPQSYGYGRYEDDDYAPPSNAHAQDEHQPYDDSHDYEQDDQDYAPYDTSRPPSEPCRDVIFLGLDLNATEESVLRYFRAEPFNVPLDVFSIVRDRASGQSRGFGFGMVASLDSAKTFVRQL